MAWPRSYCTRFRCRSSFGSGAISAIAAAACATWPAPRHTCASCSSCSRCRTRMKSQGCQFCEDGDLRPDSRISSRWSSAIGRSSNDRTFRRDRIASHVCTSVA
ncbi:MAG: hypothetical protein WA794_00375 [Trebonia sp.]